MDYENVRSCVINIPKPKVYYNNHKKFKIIVPSNKVRNSEKLPRKPSEVSLRKYSVPGELPLQRRHFGIDELLLSFTQFAREQHRVRHKQKLGISVSERYKIISTNLKKRLHVDYPPNEVRTIKDTDNDFFNYVNGRLLARRDACYKSFSFLCNYRLRKKMEVGYRNDTIFSIDLSFKKEKEIYDKSVTRYTEQVKFLDQFILEDYRKSMECLENWEDVQKKLHLKNIELQNFAAEIFTTTSKLILLDYRYAQQQKYGRFLYYVSSPTWRSQNREFAQSIEIEAKGFDLGNSSEDDTFSVLFEKMQRECVKSLVKPALYFLQPSDLMNVFESIQIQERYHFMHVMRMATQAKSLDRAITLLKQKISQDTATVAGTIEGFEAEVKFYYERSKQLEEKFFQILHGWFYQCVGAPDVLKFTLHLEFCFEKIFNEKPVNMGIKCIAKAIEDTFMVYLSRLDAIGGTTVVKQAIKQFMKEEKLKNKKSREAAKELRLFERLEHELLQSFSPVSKKGESPPVLARPRRSVSFACKTKRNRSKGASAANKMSLTDSEREYLLLFTDWTDGEDPNLFLHRS